MIKKIAATVALTGSLMLAVAPAATAASGSDTSHSNRLIDPRQCC